MSAPRMAPTYPFDCQQCTVQQSVSGECLYGILATGRGIATGGGEMGRYSPLVEAHHGYGQCRRYSG